MEIVVTNHAAERYAKRIADREAVIDIKTYVVQNKQKIDDDIQKMMDHAEFIYKGKVGSEVKNGIVDVYLSGTWVLLLDPSNAKVITLYKIDFGLGEDFNKEFVGKVKAKLEEHKSELAEIIEETNAEAEAYQGIIAENEQQIKEFQASIKNLQELNESYRDVCKNITARTETAKANIRKDVETLIQRQDF